MSKGSIDDIKEAETPKPAPAKAFSYQNLRDLMAAQVNMDALFRERLERNNAEDEADRARANNARLEKARLAKEANLAVNGVDNIRGAMKGIKGQLGQMSKGSRVEALRVIGAALRPYCPEAADYLESVE